MSMSLVKVSLAVMVLSLAGGCGKQDVASDAATTPAPVETPATAPTAPTATASTAVTLMDYDALVTPVAGGNCALDTINGDATAGASAKIGSEVMFNGWIADAGNQVPTEARLVLKGAEKAYSAPLVAGAERLDVAASLKADSLKFSGYNVLVKLDVVPGTYELSIVHGPANAAAYCSLNASLAVTN